MLSVPTGVRRTRGHARRQRGFSLIEVVVTMTVLALILFAAVPSIGSWMDNTRIRNVADSLQNGLQIARGEAVRRNEEVSFWLVSLEDPSTLDNECALSATSASWVVSVFSPLGHCADEPSTVSSPKLVTGRPVGQGSPHNSWPPATLSTTPVMNMADGAAR